MVPGVSVKVATVFVAWWEGQLDVTHARRVLAQEVVPVPAE